MAWENPTLIASFTAGGTIVANRLVKITGDNTVSQSAAGADISIGLAREAAVVNDQGVGVVIDGIARAEAGAAITAGVQVMSDGSGRVIAATATNVVIGVALEAASAAGNIISVALVSPTIL